jgi:chemotaxis protein methyltransferase CheR
VTHVPTMPTPVPPNVLATVAELVEARSGLHFVGGRRPELASKATRIFAESGCATWDAYLACLSGSSGGPMLGQLIEALTVGETYFFRHRPYFDLLEREVLPQLIAERRQTRQLRLWSAGCATGEEAYSLAILVRRLLPDLDDWHVSILATDLNHTFLAQAREGLYGEWSFRGADEGFKAANFTPEGRRYRIRPEVARLVRFAQLNLAADGYPSPADGIANLDLILCRNVLIYFASDLSSRIVARLRAALVPEGWLVLGPSDALPGLLSGFEPHAGHDAILYRRVADERPRPSSHRSVSRDELVPASASVRRARELPASITRSPVHPLAETPARPNHAVAGDGGIVGSRAEGRGGCVSGDVDWEEAWQAGRASAAQGRFEEAEAHCCRATTRGALRAEPFYLLGILRQARGDEADALEAFRKALYVDRAFVPALLAVAAVYRHGGQPDRARRALARAQRLLIGRSDAEVILAEEALTVGRLRDALSVALDDACGGPS